SVSLRARTVTVTTPGSAEAWRSGARFTNVIARFGNLVGTASATLTTTRTCRGSANRTEESLTPTLTVSDTVVFAPSIDTPSVITLSDARSFTRLSGPTTAIVLGSVETSMMSYPGAGSPSIVGLTGTSAVRLGSSTTDTVEGSTLLTSMPSGTLM